MALTKADDGLALSRMALCQICGMPLDSRFTLADEERRNLSDVKSDPTFDITQAYVNRPELRSLDLATRIYDQKVQIARSEFLPQVALTGNYLISNPSVYNGFEKKFKGLFNVGVMVSAPLFEWGENRYKIRAAKADAAIARYELSDAKEKVELQVNQQSFRVKEAAKTLTRARTNVARADENLKTAEVGFKAGVIPTSDLLQAQTAWLSAHSDVIDAEIDVRMTQIYLQKSLGILE
jgi:outer membrane protein TolC